MMVPCDYIKSYLESINHGFAEVLERLGLCLIQDRENSQSQQCCQDAVGIRILHGRTDGLNYAAAQFGLGVVRCETWK